MNKILSAVVLLCSCLLPVVVAAQDNDNLLGIFDGRTPCQEVAKQLNEPTTPACIKIKWRLRLYKNGADTTSGTYTLEGFVFRGDKILKGTWQSGKGTKADAQAIVYQLNHPAKGIICFMKADNNVLFFLDRDKNIMTGNRNFSYVLYRTN